MIPFLAEMKAIHDETESDSQWMNQEFDPPTVGWNIGINDHNHAINIKAPQSRCTVYFRPMPDVDGQALMERARAAAERCGLEFIVERCADAVYVDPESSDIGSMVQIADSRPPATVAYGTDAAMFRDLRRIVVFGPGSIAQAHTCDEWISLEQMQRGADAYERVFRHWLSQEAKGG